MLLSTAGKVLNRTILKRIREAVHRVLRENQAGFRPSGSTACQITTLRISVEQSLEWRTALCINVIDYEKSFDSLDRNALWDLMANYGIPSIPWAHVRCKTNTNTLYCFTLLSKMQMTPLFLVLLLSYAL